MKKIALAALALVLTPAAFAASLANGDYFCDDGGTLELKRKSLTAYYASLTYADGSASTLDTIDFRNTDSMVGIMYPDDEGTIGRALIINRGRAIRLQFHGGSVLTCSL